MDMGCEYHESGLCIVYLWNFGIEFFVLRSKVIMIGAILLQNTLPEYIPAVSERSVFLIRYNLPTLHDTGIEQIFISLKSDRLNYVSFFVFSATI